MNSKFTITYSDGFYIITFTNNNSTLNYNANQFVIYATGNPNLINLGIPGAITTVNYLNCTSPTATSPTDFINAVLALNTGNYDTLTVSNNLQLNSSPTIINGLTAGSLACSMPYQGQYYKKVIIFCNGYENDTTNKQTYTFPTSFTNIPLTTTNTAGLPGTVTTTSISFAPNNTTIYNGYLVLEGY